MKNKILKIVFVLFFLSNVAIGQEEYFVQVNPSTCSYSILDSIPIIKWIAIGTSTFDKINRRYIFQGMDNEIGNYICSINVSNGSTFSIPILTSQLSCLKFDNSNGVLYGIHWTTSLANADFISINPIDLSFTIINHINLSGIESEVTFDDINHRYIFVAYDKFRG